MAKKKTVKKNPAKKTGATKKSDNKPVSVTYGDLEKGYQTFKKAKETGNKLVNASFNGDVGELESIVGDTFNQYSVDLTEGDRTYQSQGLGEAIASKDARLLTEIGKVTYPYVYGKIIRDFQSNFTDKDKLSGILKTSPKELQGAIANGFYDSGNNGSDPEFHGKHKELVYRTESLGLLEDPKFKPKHNKDLTREKVIEDIKREYEEGRNSYDDPALDETARNLDTLFGKPQGLYVGRFEKLSSEFYEELPKHTGYLSNIAKPEELMNAYIGWFENEDNK